MKDIIRNTILEYHGSHRAPQEDIENSPFYDLENMFPDIYTNKANRYYCSEYRTIPNIDCGYIINLIQSSYNKPNKKIKIYRSVPSNIENLKIEIGDWITISKEYAIFHGKSHLNNEYKILEKEVLAKQIWSDGNSIFEYGLSI